MLVRWDRILAPKLKSWSWGGSPDSRQDLDAVVPLHTVARYLAVAVGVAAGSFASSGESFSPMMLGCRKTNARYDWGFEIVCSRLKD